MTPLLIAASVAFSSTVFEARGDSLRDPDSVQGPGSSVPIEVCGGHLITLAGEVGGISGLRLLLDTGTARTIVDTRLAERLELPPTPSEILGFGGSAAAAEIVVPSVRIGPLSRVNVRVLSADLDAVTATFGCPHDVLVGADLLRGTCFSIDYEKKTMFFRCHGKWDARVDFDPTSPYLVVEAVIDEVGLQLVVDTGSAVIAVFGRAAPTRWNARVDAAVDATAVGGRVRLHRLPAQSVALGPVRWHGQAILIMPDGGPDVSYDGVLGIRALALREVQFDLVRMRFSWRDPAPQRR